MRFPEVSLGNLTNIRTGKLDANASSEDGEYPFFTCAQKPLRISSYSYDCECVLIAGNGDLNVKYYQGKFDAYQRTYIVESLLEKRSKLSLRYTYHFLETYLETLREQSIGGIIKYIKMGNLTEAQIPLPPLAEQKRIAGILDAADALRAKRRADLAQLDSLTQSLFLDLFGDPVENERGWPVTIISDFVAGFESGKSLVAGDEDASESPFRVLKISAVTPLEFRPEQSKALPPDYVPPASHFVRDGDLLFSRANTSELIGATAYVRQAPANLLLPDKLWRFVWHESPKADPRFVRFLFQRPKFRAEIASRATGTSGSMKNISQGKVLTISCGLPPLPLQRRFAAMVESIERQKTRHRAHLAELDALFASLQHRAFRGEL